jgi:tRNA 2-selenouridine synthase
LRGRGPNRELKGQNENRRMSIQVIDQADPENLGRFDAIIDVRSPAEFADDHVPGAQNLPVLSNEERAEVGAIYVQRSAFLARRIGAAHVARNVAHHLETALAEQPASFAPLVYCWRGGQRSSAMATILSQVGWRASLLQGGYRTYRRRVSRRLYDDPCPMRLILLDGGTGSAKSEILVRLAALGLQVLDLESLAGHRGSLFGGFASCPQPRQKMFESRLLAALDALDPEKPVIVEAESSRIGDLFIPPALWTAMRDAARIEIIAPRAERARYLVGAYGDIVANRPALEAAFSRLPTHPGRERLDGWRRLADAGEFEALAEALIALHYDPAYARSARKDARPRSLMITLDTLEAAAQAAAAESIAGWVKAEYPTP